MSNKPSASKNWAGGYDLNAERDSGNMVTILTGKPECSLEFWQSLLLTAQTVVETLLDETQ
jgi:hypothetical protein